jgi:hypothetical protein
MAAKALVSSLEVRSPAKSSDAQDDELEHIAETVAGNLF